VPRPLPRIDRAGRPQQEPHKLFSHIEGINWLAERVPVRKIPGAAWAQDNDHAIIACPCKTDCRVEILNVPQKCEGCERHYVFTGRDAWCFNSPFDYTESEISART
jgi:hypothetical protein